MFTIENEKIRVTLQELGAVVLGIYNKETQEEHFWQYDSNIWPRRTAVCFPVCGALIDGEYTYNGKTYALPPHGFLREMSGKLTKDSEDHAFLSFSDTDQTRANYPFSFNVTIDYTLEGSTLVIRYLVRNTGDCMMPYSMGGHYTYNLPRPQTECKYFFSAPQKALSFAQEGGRIYGYDEKPFFKGNCLEMENLFEVSAKIFRLDELDTDFIGIGYGDRMFTKVEYSGFKYVVLWSPKGNNCPFACIEPWDGLPDVQGHDKNILNKHAIVRLNPGEGKTYIQRVTV